MSRERYNNQGLYRKHFRGWRERHLSPIGDPESIRWQIHDAAKEVLASHQKMDEAFYPQGTKSVAEIIYQSNPYIYDWLGSQMKLNSLLTEGWRKQEENGTILSDLLVHAEVSPVLTKEINGVSLIDLQQLNTPLTNEDARTMHKIISGKKILSVLRPPSDVDRSIFTTLVHLATQKHVDPEYRKHTPDNIKGIERGLHEYFDYLTHLFADPDFTDDNVKEFLYHYNKGGNNMLEGTLTYMPARLGITPSSTNKLFAEFVDSSLYTLAFRKMKKSIYQLTSKTYRENALPADLMEYIHHNEENDSNAVQAIKEHKEVFTKSAEDFFSEYELSEKEREEFTNLQSQLHSRVATSKEKRMSFSTQDNPLIQKVTITSMYPQTTMFILTLANNSHITMEIDRSGRVYGIPPEAAKTFPHIKNQLSHMVLSEIKAYQEQQKKESKPTPIPYTQPTEPLKISNYTGSKRKRNTTPVSGPEEPIQPIEAPHRTQPHPVVLSDENIITELLGHNNSSENQELVFNTLRKFEQGKIQPEALHGPYKGLVKLRAGNLRLLLRHHGDQHWEIVDVGKRDKIYKKFYHKSS